MTSELFDIINKNYCNGDVEETIAVVNEMVRLMLLSNKFAYDLKLECEEFALKYDKCPECGSDLHYEEHEEAREYWGNCVTETITEKFCTNGCDLP
ncbi:hypothetical protein [Clostridium sp.]|uniref:hypothetical protein n=1 Tax=Clostridium sp. TaxID=1506 RepID=UPI001B5B5F03|nr:hypothetical protein [Clostridium sp.]MBP3914522.1 hypothetical protein [Clostridium sp.]